MEPQLVKAQGFCKGLQMHCISHTCMHTHPPTPTYRHSHTTHTRTQTHTLCQTCAYTNRRYICSPSGFQFLSVRHDKYFQMIPLPSQKGGCCLRWRLVSRGGGAGVLFEMAPCVGGRGCCLRWCLVSRGGGCLRWFSCEQKQGIIWAGALAVSVDSCHSV